jgi:hypothetical protein
VQSIIEALCVPREDGLTVVDLGARPSETRIGRRSEPLRSVSWSEGFLRGAYVPDAKEAGKVGWEYPQDGVAQICLATPELLQAVRWMYESCEVVKNGSDDALRAVRTGLYIPAAGVEKGLRNDGITVPAWPVRSSWIFRQPSLGAGARSLPPSAAAEQAAAKQAAARSFDGGAPALARRAFACPHGNRKTRLVGVAEWAAQAENSPYFYWLNNSGIRAAITGLIAENRGENFRVIAPGVTNVAPLLWKGFTVKAGTRTLALGPKVNASWTEKAKAGPRDAHLTFSVLENGAESMAQEDLELCVLLGQVPYWVQDASLDYARYHEESLAALETVPIDLAEVPRTPVSAAGLFWRGCGSPARGVLPDELQAARDAMDFGEAQLGGKAVRQCESDGNACDCFSDRAAPRGLGPGRHLAGGGEGGGSSPGAGRAREERPRRGDAAALEAAPPPSPRRGVGRSVSAPAA